VADTTAADVAQITGYTLVLPPGWRRIPVRHGTKPAVRAIVDEVLHRVSKGISRDKLTRYRIELERRLSDLAKQARPAGGVDLYLPIEYVHGVTITASFVVSQLTLPDPAGEMAGTAEAAAAASADTAQLIAYLTSEAGEASSVVIAGAAAARKESVAPADPAQQMPFGSRRADYLVPVPGEPRGLLVVAFSTIGDGDPEGDFAKLMLELFDAIMLTFRWTRDDAQE
jgi:hypothetical protein